MPEQIQVVWFKRDLRCADHAPLSFACQRGPVLPLYVIEPAILCAPDADVLHYRFIYECLVELRRNLSDLGQGLIVRVGDPVEIFEALHKRRGNFTLWSHEETGNALTFTRDLAVGEWTRYRGIKWFEIPQNGVVRRLKNRDRWSKAWETRMGEKLLPAPEFIKGVPNIQSGEIPSPDALPEDLRLHDSACRQRNVIQVGGEKAGQAWLESFFSGRGAGYRRGMSSPSLGATACSRISPYLAWGALSMRQAAHAAWAGLRNPGAGIPKSAVSSFLGRLHWHCHFMQKLESEPEIEFHAFNRACDTLRDDPDPQVSRSQEKLDAWLHGFTGYPFLDACMRSLRATGWLNFRMRAMLVSFAAYDLWLDWRLLKDPLARHFLDYEPGIHISQIQMQSGTTGINTMRIYNPVKQGLEHDADGEFVRRWVPEIAGIPTAFIHQPWLLGKPAPGNYPAPIVDHASAVREAKARFTSLKKTEHHRAEARRVFEKHGSRKRHGDASEAAQRTKGQDLVFKQKARVLKVKDVDQMEIPLFSKQEATGVVGTSTFPDRNLGTSA